VPKLERDLESALRAASQAQAQVAAAAAQAYDSSSGGSGGSNTIAEGDGSSGSNSSGNSGPATSTSGSGSGNYPPSNAPRITEPPKELVQWLQRALGGKKHRKAAAAYALNLCQSLGANPALPVEAVVRNESCFVSLKVLHKLHVLALHHSPPLWLDFTKSSSFRIHSFFEANFDGMHASFNFCSLAF